MLLPLLGGCSVLRWWLSSETLEKHSEQERQGMFFCFSDLVGLSNSAMLYFVTEVGEDIGELEEEGVSLAESTGDDRRSSLTGWA